MHRLLAVICAALGAVVVAPVSASAQAVRLGVAGGVAVPIGAYGETRSSGPLVRGSVMIGGLERRVRFRGDVEAAWMLAADDHASTVPGSHFGTLRALSVLGSVLIGGTGPGFAPYVIAGLGAQRLRVDGSSNPYGTTIGARIGAGVRWRVGRTLLHAELTPHWALSDFATGRDFGVGSYVPATLGISF